MPTSPSANEHPPRESDAKPTPTGHSSTTDERAPTCAVQATPDSFRLPVETEIYVLPNGEIVVADLPEELLSLLSI